MASCSFFNGLQSTKVDIVFGTFSIIFYNYIGTVFCTREIFSKHFVADLRLLYFIYLVGLSQGARPNEIKIVYSSKVAGTWQFLFANSTKKQATGEKTPLYTKISYRGYR
jgi:hypothetical protein